MKVIKKLVVAIVGAAIMLSSAATVLADETTASSTPAGTTTADISNVKFETAYGTQLPQYLNRQYSFNGNKIPVPESNYYYITVFLTLSQYAAYGIYPSTADNYIDLSKTYGNDGKTYGDLLTEQAELYLERIYIYKSRAEEAGISIGDEEKNTIEDVIKQLNEQQAKPTGSTLETILKLHYGPGCDEKAFRSILENAALASKYTQKYIEDYQVPENQKKIPSITYALFYAPSTATNDEKSKAQASASEMLSKCKSIDDLKTLCTEAKTAGTCRDAGTLPVQKGKMVPAFEAWAYGAERKEGEMAVIYSDEYGYFCVGYNGLVDLDENEKKDMATNALNAEVDQQKKDGKYDFKRIEGKAGLNNTIVVVFAAIGAVALVAIFAVLVSNKVKESKNAKKPVKSTIKTGSKSSSGKKNTGKGSGNKSVNKNGNKNGSKKTGSAKPESKPASKKSSEDPVEE